MQTCIAGAVSIGPVHSKCILQPTLRYANPIVSIADRLTEPAAFRILYRTA